jgi:hypothetical protein
MEVRLPFPTCVLDASMVGLEITRPLPDPVGGANHASEQVLHVQLPSDLVLRTGQLMHSLAPPMPTA